MLSLRLRASFGADPGTEANRPSSLVAVLSGYLPEQA
jgi:hypothetical protein